MRRNAAYFTAAAVLSLAVFGCESPDKQESDALSAGTTPDYYSSADPAYDSTTASDPYQPAYGSPTTTDSTYSSMGGGRTHTVAKSDTLYSLARSYYGDQRRWRDIYEANRGTISDPNKIFVGQQLVIP